MYGPFMFTTSRFTRLVQTMTMDIKQPAVVDAPQSPVFQPSVAQVSSPVWAMDIQESWVPLLVSKEDQVFAKKPYRQWRYSWR